MQLKRLEPVATSAAAVSAKAGSIYAFVRHYVPTRIEGTVGQAEGKAASLASPYVALLSNKAATALAAVDSKVQSFFKRWRERPLAMNVHVAHTIVLLLAGTRQIIW
jgi:hypothetical protein